MDFMDYDILINNMALNNLHHVSCMICVDASELSKEGLLGEVSMSAIWISNLIFM